MKKLRLDPELLQVHSFHATDAQPYSAHGPSDTVVGCCHAASEGGADTACAGTIRGQEAITDPPVCPTGDACTQPATMVRNTCI
jgi:hypothetical protein